MRVVFVTSELYPFIKTGGLADVSSAIPKYLAKNGIDVSVFMPLYLQIDLKKHKIVNTNIKIEFEVATRKYSFELYKKIQDGFSIYFLHNPYLFYRQKIYGNYFDNEIRFGIFCYGVIEAIKLLKIEPDIVHLNDWQTALLAFLLKKKYFYSYKVIFLIHNFAYQGIFQKSAIDRLGLGWSYFKMEFFEYFDQLNFLKAGVAFSDVVITVSKSYAKEITEAEFGGALAGFMKANEYKLIGIQNGIDTIEFDPKSDPFIYKNYSKEHFELREQNKLQLCANLGIKYPHRVLFAFLGRLTHQKGIDFILDTILQLVRLDANFVLLGDGEGKYADMFLSLANRFDNIFPILGYDEALARKIYASADFIMMPSIFEPSGLNQLIAMRYGSVPIIRNCGGLQDTVCDYLECQESKDKGIGITFNQSSSIEFIFSIMRAYGLYQNKKRLKKIIDNNFDVDFSWDRQIKEYITIYKKLKSS